MIASQVSHEGLRSVVLYYGSSGRVRVDRGHGRVCPKSGRLHRHTRVSHQHRCTALTIQLGCTGANGQEGINHGCNHLPCERIALGCRRCRLPSLVAEVGHSLVVVSVKNGLCSHPHRLFEVATPRLVHTQPTQEPGVCLMAGHGFPLHGHCIC